jgi:UDP-N-acetylglucosamine 2-epimerase (non-hydrolysing)
MSEQLEAGCSRIPVGLVVGTRPEAIKMAPVYFALAGSRHLRPVLISTGQHREMLDQSLGVFGLKPDVDLQLMVPGQTLAALTARVLTAMTGILGERKLGAILVQGDTTTVLASSLAAFYERIPIGHVEAGLRTHDLGSPWPEEMNRRLADPLARWCFAPTEMSRLNLLSERIPEARVHVVGNTVVDALLWMKQRQQGAAEHPLDRVRRCGVDAEFGRRHFGDRDGGGTRWILVTGHRRESFGEGLDAVCRSILQIVERHPDVGVVYPVHLNPNVRASVYRLLRDNSRIALIEPLGYEDFTWFMSRCHFLLSDSGGVQEEAPSLGKPVLVTRDTTERPEGVSAGTSRLVGTDPDRILSEACLLLDDAAEYATRSRLRNPYGDGRSASRIARILENDIQG